MQKTYKQIRIIANELVEKYKSEDWFRGVGIGHEAGIGFYISIRKESGYFPKLPNSIKGVTIRVEQREKAVALTS
jgi:hypothetical protein